MMDETLETPNGWVAFVIIDRSNNHNRRLFLLFV